MGSASKRSLATSRSSILGLAEQEGDQQAGWRAHEVQAQSPEPARAAGAVAIGGPPGQVAAQSGRARPSALDRRRIDDPGVVVEVLGVARQEPDDGPELALGLAQSLVIARLVRDVGEPGLQMHHGVTQEPRLGREAQEGLEHGERQELASLILGASPTLGRRWRSSGRIRSASSIVTYSAVTKVSRSASI